MCYKTLFTQGLLYATDILEEIFSKIEFFIASGNCFLHSISDLSLLG